MVELIAKTPCEGLLPLKRGRVTLTEIAPGPMTSLAPYKGKARAFSDALKAAHGMEAPAPNRSTGREGERAIWFGKGIVLLMGKAADASLAAQAALTDQSDAWAVVKLEGAGVRDVLARLTPLDLRDGQFRRGHTARSDLKHMMASITRIGDEAWMIMVFRAFAETLVHDLKIAMETVAAR